MKDFFLQLRSLVRRKTCYFINLSRSIIYMGSNRRYIANNHQKDFHINDNFIVNKTIHWPGFALQAPGRYI